MVLGCMQRATKKTNLDRTGKFQEKKRYISEVPPLKKEDKMKKKLIKI